MQKITNRTEAKSLLSYDQMSDACFARLKDMDPDFENGEQAALYTAMRHYDNQGMYQAEETKKERDKALDRYKKGKAVLEDYTLAFTKRTTTPYYANGKPAIPDFVEDYYIVDAGYIASSPAYRFAIFSPRIETKLTVIS